VTELTLNATLTADGSGFVGEVKRSKAELDKLTATQGQSGQVTERAAGQVSGLNRAIKQSTVFLGRNRFAVQQAGFQVGDFAVQIASGQSAMRAFIQQGAQFFGIFGPIGAVLGAAVAVGGAVATTLIQTGDAMADAGDEADVFGDRLKTLEGVMKKLKGTAELTPEALDASRRNTVGIIENDLKNAKDRLATLIAEARAAQEAAAQMEAVIDTPPVDSSEIKAAREEVRRLNLVLAEARSIAGEFGNRLSGSAENARRALKRLRDNEERARRERESAAERAARLRDAANGLIDDQIKGLKFEQAQLGRTARERAIHTALLRAETIARRANEKVSDDQRAALIAETGALFDLNEARRKAGDEDRQRQRDRDEALRQRQRDAEVAAEAIRRPFENAAGGIQTAFTDFFDGAFDRSVDSAAEAADAMKRVFIRAAAEIASAFVFEPFVGSILKPASLGDLAA